MTDVVITGVGAITPIGASADELWTSLKAGVSGANEIAAFDLDQYGLSTSVACEITDFDPADHDEIDERTTGRFAQFATVAAMDALEDAALDPASEVWDPDRVGVSIGTCTGGGLELFEDTRRMEAGEQSRFYSSLVVLSNLAAGTTSIVADARGPNRAPATACAAGTHALTAAADDLRADRADVMIAGGAEAPILPLLLEGFESLRAYSTADRSPAAHSRPFDADRDGLVFGEGAGVLVLETREHAEARGADILATLAGGAMTADASHPIRPSGDGLARAMEQALEAAELAPNSIDHVNAHATSTPKGDAVEAAAIRDVFGADVPPVTGFKGHLGHSFGAAGALEAVIATQMIQDDYVPGTLNHRESDCDVPVVGHGAGFETDVNTVLSNSAGFGGTNGSVVLRAPIS
ncbi:beta-ketoacyl-[acyl-carrier-protein] synthase family protein [Natronoglomus mannanivorans]|uniref:Beta-ketoacyl-[acyl-carrier-protein] synthase family protein n=1 Tax=Natronoglomus mannanivorans TaxID=2979990 RepID=A0AAP2Z392_9EURY|nr:beta-ketoacyl-[acyl-carrier-protein] synthase family protein [Halobacteria archaeon AArc-xg1-1]